MEKLVINLNKLDKLAYLAGKPPTSIHLVAKEYDHPGLNQLFQTLVQHGAALGALDVSLAFPHHPYNHDLRDFDFAAACPNLQNLTVGRCRLNESVMLHPTLQHLTLKESWLYVRDPLRLGYADSPVSYITDLSLDDVNWGNQDEDRLELVSFGSNSPLRKFTYYLDEDYSELYAETMIFESCPELEDVTIHVCGGWEVAFKGDLPQLTNVGLSSQRYGDHRLYFDDVGDGSTEYMLKLRDGHGPLDGDRFLFIGEFNYLNMNKVKHIITQWGGRVVEKATPDLTYAVLGEGEFTAYEAETPTPQTVEITQLVAQGAEIKVIDDSELRGWIIDGLY